MMNLFLDSPITYDMYISMYHEAILNYWNGYVTFEDTIKRIRRLRMLADYGI